MDGLGSRTSRSPAGPGWYVHFAGPDSWCVDRALTIHQISRHENFALPTFLCEYGANTAKIRNFEETKVLYSDPMARVFSGGCVYELVDGANSYGLVAMPGSNDPRWLRFRTCIEDKIIETRQTDAGEIHIYQDFANYKASLAEPTDDDPSWSIMEREAEERFNTNVTQMTWPWGPEYQMPATCIDWDNIEELVGR
jgi:hypothetical protein